MMAGRRWPRAGYLRAPLADLVTPAIEATDADLARALREEDEAAAAQHACRVLQQVGHAPRVYADIRALALDAEEIQARWSANGTESANRGTWMHLTFELWLNRDGVSLEGQEMAMFQRWVREYPERLRAFRTEWEVYGEEENIAGSIDFVAEDEDGALVLVDWKRTKQLRDSFDNRWRKMSTPLEHLPDCKGAHYELQLNCYRYIVQKYYGRRVSRMLIVCTHPDNGDEAFVHEVPLREKETAYLMWWQRDRCSALVGERMLRGLGKDVPENTETPAPKKQKTAPSAPGAAPPAFPFHLG